MLPMQIRLLPRLLLWSASAALAACSAAAPAPTHRRGNEAVHWLGTWASSQQIPEPDNTLPPAALTNATLRQIVHLSVGGHELRIRFSNVFGTSSLRIVAAHIAKPVSRTTGQIDPATDTPLTFGGRAGVTIRPGAAYHSDPVAFDAKPLSDLAVTIYL
ncbi:MAG: SGNH/GDSL hydrolase family protein, partial [Steroidobacteraceae bacterium]